MVLGHTMSLPQWHPTHPLGLNGGTHGPGTNTKPHITLITTRQQRPSNSITTTKITWPCMATILIEAGGRPHQGPLKDLGVNPAIAPKAPAGAEDPVVLRI